MRSVGREEEEEEVNKLHVYRLHRVDWLLTLQQVRNRTSPLNQREDECTGLARNNGTLLQSCM